MNFSLHFAPPLVHEDALVHEGSSFDYSRMGEGLGPVMMVLKGGTRMEFKG